MELIRRFFLARSAQPDWYEQEKGGPGAALFAF
jgi:hypothetical protein